MRSNKNLYLQILIILWMNLFSTVAIGEGFFYQENRYKGFYWFEKILLKKEQQKSQPEYQIPSPESAAQILEERKKKLDDARNQMLVVAYDQNAPASAVRESLIDYRKLENQMWGSSLRLAESSEMSNLINPDMADLRENPTNVFAAKLKRKVEAENQKITIMEFANEFDLLLFAEDSCAYCIKFAPVLKSFVQKHNFSLDITDLNGKAGDIAQKLGISAMPTLVAVKKDSSQLFEISRGMVGISDLENSIILAKKYSKELTETEPKKLNKRRNNNKKISSNNNLKTLGGLHEK